MSRHEGKAAHADHAAVGAAAAMEVDAAPVDAAEAAAASEQLRAIARLLGVAAGAGQLQAAPVLAAVSEKVGGMLESLPQSFFAPLLPPGSLSAGQVRALLRAMLCVASAPAQRGPYTRCPVPKGGCLLCCAQMAALEQLAPELTQEYTVRRRMLIERAKVQHTWGLPARRLASCTATAQ